MLFQKAGSDKIRSIGLANFNHKQIERLMSTAQVALRWAVQQNIVVIPKSTREQSIRENADLFDFQLTDEEMKAIDGMDRGWRILHLGDDADHPLYPFSEEY
ncbi:hypothetical protein ANCDUO_08549 [Ancylostoma duodenale]|uniref:NADP-dependent oxidoreductase domain-containing protein n=1 Tax=Ancylostoma duodenale TaxID=51022 RepID=A0A0C2DFE8_9BILA|nr:hypothetical protein ANCDUO_08549 [Ancylostoma duodenale]